MNFRILQGNFGPNNDYMVVLSIILLISNVLASPNGQQKSKQMNLRIGLTEENLNPNVKRMKYIDGGPFGGRCGQIQKELKEGKKFPFTDVIKAQVGDLQALGTKSVTFFRQVLTLVNYPEMKNISNFPSDVQNRADDILNECESKSASAYTDTIGLDIVRSHIAEFITRRDNVIPAKKENIVLCAGSTNCIRVIFKLFADQCKPNVAGVLFGSPAFSLFSASLAENGLFEIRFFYDEHREWEVSLDELNRAIRKGRLSSDPRAIFIINPSNPTGAILSRGNIETIIKFAHKENILIMADEVYQDNIYTIEKPFYSFRKVMYEMDKQYHNTQMISFYSASKGYMGETGVRAGYIEHLNLDKAVVDLLEKSISTTLMPSVLGQTMLSCICKPPVKNDPSYELFSKEKANTLTTLAYKAKIVRDAFNDIPGFTATPFYGSMYSFPNITIPPKAIKKARDNNQAPDIFYANDLLENTGVCVIPGADFQERENTYHFRVTNLPQIEKLREMLEKIKDYNAKFLEKYK